MTARPVVNLQPTAAILLAYAGDPFDFHLTIRDEDGEAVDVTGWEWRATVMTGRLRVHFETITDDDGLGVRLFMRGDDTARLGAVLVSTVYPFDVTCRQPDAGEGRTVLRGTMTAARRVTDPLRSDGELVAL